MLKKIYKKGRKKGKKKERKTQLTTHQLDLVSMPIVALSPFE